MKEGEVFPQRISCQKKEGKERKTNKQRSRARTVNINFATLNTPLGLLTGFRVERVGCVLVAGEHADYDGVVAVLDELLHLFHRLHLLGGRACLRDHVVNDA